MSLGSTKIPQLHRYVLVVDDHPGAAEGIGRLLARLGWEVSKAVTGQEAIELCRRRAPDAVLLDISLPDMDGFAVLEALRTLPRMGCTRFVAMSGQGDERFRTRALDVGFHAFVRKPVSLETFRSALQT